MKAIFKIYFKSQLMGEVYSEQNAGTFRRLGFEVRNIWNEKLQGEIDDALINRRIKEDLLGDGER